MAKRGARHVPRPAGARAPRHTRLHASTPPPLAWSGSRKLMLTRMKPPSAPTPTGGWGRGGGGEEVGFREGGVGARRWVSGKGVWGRGGGFQGRVCGGEEVGFREGCVCVLSHAASARALPADPPPPLLDRCTQATPLTPTRLEHLKVLVDGHCVDDVAHVDAACRHNRALDLRAAGGCVVGGVARWRAGMWGGCVWRGAHTRLGGGAAPCCTLAAAPQRPPPPLQTRSPCPQPSSRSTA